MSVLKICVVYFTKELSTHVVFSNFLFSISATNFWDGQCDTVSWCSILFCFIPHFIDIIRYLYLINNHSNSPCNSLIIIAINSTCFVSNSLFLITDTRIEYQVLINKCIKIRFPNCGLSLKDSTDVSGN